MRVSMWKSASFRGIKVVTVDGANHITGSYVDASVSKKYWRKANNSKDKTLRSHRI